MEGSALKIIQNKFLILDVNEYTCKKMQLSYLSWAMAYREALKICPDIKYTILKDINGFPAFGNNENGYMVYTEITIENETREMWLPVMDHRNKTILKPNMFEINKALMRCLTKNLAMFGLGIYIYAGEDLPEIKKGGEEKQQEKPNNQNNAKDKEVNTKKAECEGRIKDHLKGTNLNKEFKKEFCIKLFNMYDVEANKLSDLTKEQISELHDGIFNKNILNDVYDLFNNKKEGKVSNKVPAGELITLGEVRKINKFVTENVLQGKLNEWFQKMGIKDAACIRKHELEELWVYLENNALPF